MQTTTNTKPTEVKKMRSTAATPAARAAAILPAVALLLILAATAAIRSEDSGKLRKINISTEGDHLYVKLTGTSRFRYRVKTEENPPRMTIQLYNTSAELGYNSLNVNQGYVKDVKIQESTTNGQRATFVILHLNQNVAIDYGLSGDGRTLYVSTPTYAGAGKGSVSAYSAEPGVQPGKSQSSNNTPAKDTPSLGGLPPEITVPGGAPSVKQTPSEMVPYAGSTTAPVTTAGGFTDFSQNRGPDNSPYIVGPVILQDADVSKAVQLLSEAAGGASIIVESSVLESSAKSTGEGGGGGGITMTLSHITLEDALDVISSANGWVWKKIAGSYLIVSKETANQGLKIVESATAFDITNEKLQVTVYKPKYIDSCSLLGYVQNDIPQSACDNNLNYILLKGRFEDIERAKAILAQVDTSKNLNATKAERQFTDQMLNKTAQDLVTHIVRLKYIRAEGLQTQLTSLMQNPFFGNLKIVTARIGGDKMAGNEISMNTLSIDKDSNTLVFVGREEIFRRLQQVIQSLDVPFSATVIKNVQLKNAFVDDFQYDMDKTIISSIGRENGNDKVMYNSMTNTITFIGTEDNFNRLMQIIQNYDTDDKAVVTETLQFKNLKVIEILRSNMLSMIDKSPYYGYPQFWNGGTTSSSNIDFKSGRGGSTKVTAHQPTNSFVITAQKQYMDRIKEFLKSLDQNDYELSSRLVRLKHINGVRAIAIIDSMMNTAKLSGSSSGSGGTKQTIPLDGGFWECNASEQNGDCKSGMGATIFPTTPLATGDPNARYNYVSIYYESTQNALLIKANDIDNKRINDIIKMIDVQYPQIKLDVQVVEVSDNDLKDMKRAIGYQDRKSKFNIPHSEGSVDWEPEIIDYPAHGPYDFIYNTTNDLATEFVANLNMLITSDRASIIANPSIITRENVYTTFTYQDTYTYFYTTPVAGAGGAIFQQPVRVDFDYGPTMGMRAHANLEDGTVMLQIYPTYNTLKGVGANGIPITSASSMDQEILVKSGDTVISSGFITNTESEGVKKVPLLSNLPLIGNMFKTKTNSKINKQVIFLITPTILPLL